MNSLKRNDTMNLPLPSQAGNHHDQLETDRQEASKPEGEREASPPVGQDLSKNQLLMSRRAFLVAAGMAPLVGLRDGYSGRLRLPYVANVPR
jgi:hypothetical protein